jgi:hypothetical protein
VAKRRERWRALYLSEMESAKALSREHLSIEGISDRTKSLALTSGRWSRFWSSSLRVKPEVTGTPRGVRGQSRSAIGEDNAPLGREPERAPRHHVLREEGEVETPCRDGLKLATRRQARANRGRIVARRSGATQDEVRFELGASVPSPRRAGGLRGRRGESRALGSRAVYECSCRTSIADVGEKHLSRAYRGEPQGKPRRSGVARVGGSPWTRTNRTSRATRVRGASHEP